MHAFSQGSDQQVNGGLFGESHREALCHLKQDDPQGGLELRVIHVPLISQFSYWVPGKGRLLSW